MITTARQMYNHRCYIKHRDERLAYRKQYYEEHREQELEYARQQRCINNLQK